MAQITDEMVKRAADIGASKQPRFQHPRDAQAFYSAIHQWVTKANLTAPVYRADTRKRDEWLQQFWRLEPHLSGVVGEVIAIDQNRNWNLYGGRNQVRRFAEVLEQADDGNGWREHCSLAALAYYTTDIGAIVEVGRDNADPTQAALAGLYSVDSTRCKMIKRHAPNNLTSPTLQYYPRQGEMQKWHSYDYMKLTSIPQMEEAFNGVGYCAISRVLDLARIMVGVFEHDLEQLRIAPPSGFAVFNGIDDDELKEALDARKLRRENQYQEYTSDIVYLCSPDVPIDIKLTALSNLPKDFNVSDFVQLLMLGYALAFGYDASEFYSIKYAPLTNAGTSTKVQSQKATGKGERSFVDSYRDGLQRWLPESLHLEFDDRSDEGDAIRAGVLETVIRAVSNGYNTGLAAGKPLIPRNVGRAILIEAGAGTEEQYAEGDAIEEQEKKENEQLMEKQAQQADENVPADVARTRERIRENTFVQRAAERYPDEPIVQYRSDGRERVLFRTGRDMTRRRVWQSAIADALIQKRGNSETQETIEVIAEIIDHEEEVTV